jgi:hypothetical protein
MKRFSQSLKQLLFNRDNVFKEEEQDESSQVKQPVAQRLSLPKINLDQLAPYLDPEEPQHPGESSMSPVDTDTVSASSGTGRSEETPSPGTGTSGHQRRLMPDRKSSTPILFPGISPKDGAEGAALLNIEQPHASCGKNTARTIGKLERLLKKGADTDDRPGYIYILHLPRDATQPYYKLRFSSVTLANEDVIPLTKECKISVTRYMFAESFLMLLLDSMRILRYPLDDDPPSYHTYHKASKKLIVDAMSAMTVAKPRPLARSDENWVMMTPEVLYRIVRQSVAMIDKVDQK